MKLIQIIKTAVLKLNKNDFIKTGVVVVLAAFVGSFQQALTDHGLSFSQYDWSHIFNVAWGAGAAYISKNLFTTSNGKVFGKIG